jgi:hypothetical protein
MSKHTPAPWNIHPNYTEIKPLAVVQEDGRGFVAWATYVARGTKIIAEVRGNSSSMGWGFVDNQFEIEANARLIASAPELLEALKDIIDNISKCPCEVDDNDILLWDNARRAIAKAEAL